MKLDYNIMWFEDQPDSVKNFETGLDRVLRDNGFKLDISRRRSISEQEIEELSARLQIYNPYDLIIFDHDLGSGQLGSSIARQLRHSIFTDMVYYSATNIDTLRRELFEKKIDGVFLVNKGNFVPDMQRIIEDHIKKLSDMNNIRGLVLDSISDVETKLRTLLNNRMHNMDASLKNNILKKFKARYCDKANELDNLANSLTENDLHKHVFDFRNVDFDFIRRRLAKLNSSCQILQPKEALEEMQGLRNILAHQPYSFDKNTNRVSITTEKNTEEFDFERFKEIRIKLLKIFEALDKFS